MGGRGVRVVVYVWGGGRSGVGVVVCVGVVEGELECWCVWGERKAEWV